MKNPTRMGNTLKRWCETGFQHDGYTMERREVKPKHFVYILQKIRQPGLGGLGGLGRS
jgi:hypothetical protein